MRRCLSITLAATGLLIGGLLGGAVWLTASDSGLQTAIQLASHATAGRLQIEQASGRLLGPLTIASLRWATPELQLHAEQIDLDWSPAALRHNRLHIARLQVGQLTISSTSSNEPAQRPNNLQLPLAVDVEKVTISQIEYGTHFTAQHLTGSLHSDGRQHQLHDFQIATQGAQLTGQATLDGATPFRLDAAAEIKGQLDQHPLALSLSAGGTLARIALTVQAKAGIEGEAKIELTPFAPAPLASIHLALDRIDPAAWREGAPAAELQLRAELGPKIDRHGENLADTLTGHFSLNNAQPGPLDRQQLPLSRLSGQLDWQDNSARFDQLQAKLSGGGSVSGEAKWRDNSLQLTLNAGQLDASKLLTTLRPTRLSGPLSATLAADRQDFKFDLRDRRFTLLAEASLSGEQLSLARLEIGSGQARLIAQGELGLGKAMAFKATGELHRFDPSQFAELPPALINAKLSASGRLQPQPVIDASFTLAESKLADQRLTGRGQLRIDWPRLPLADIELMLGRNQLNAKGAFGQPGDHLDLLIDAPALSPYGLEGGINGHLTLTGNSQQPKIAGRVQAARLGLPGVIQLKDLVLDTEVGGSATDLLHLDLKIAQLATPTQPALAEALSIQAEGSNQAHRLQASVKLLDDHHLQLAAEGGMQLGAPNRGWRGRLLSLHLNTPQPSRNVRLLNPAALQLSQDAWSFGPAELAGDPLDWRAKLEATADLRQLRAKLSAHGSRIGQIDGQLTAGMQGSRALDQQAPWQGQLKMDIPDLGWLTELIGDQWQSAGRLYGELKLAGTPARPLSSGRLHGEKLALRLPTQGLDLNRGELLAEFENDLLRVSKLSFDSRLQPPPRALRLAAQEQIDALTAKPGRLEISGEIAVDRNTGSNRAFLDVHLERLGAFQLPDQWISLSGDGRLSWQGDTLDAKGQLAVDAGYWQLAPGGRPRLSDDVVIKRSGNEKPPATLRPNLNLDLTTDLGQRFIFNGAGLSSRLLGEVRLSASGRDLPRASGSIRTRDGRFDAYGQQLEITRGILNFQGLLDNPALDVQAVRKGLSVEPGVQISGNVQKPVVKLISDPELPEAEKLAWLVLGHGPEQMGAGDATVLLSAAGGLLGNDSGNVVQQLKKTFGIDEFGVRQGDIGSTGSRQPASRVASGGSSTESATGNQIFSVGKRLSSNVMLTYEQALGKAESIVKLTVSLSRQISVVGRAGSDNAIDIFYTMSFGKPPRKTR